jgi:Tfp pilus assembly protein PilF
MKNAGHSGSPRKGWVLLLFALLAAIPIVILLRNVGPSKSSGEQDDFEKLTNTGKNLYDRGDTNGSIAALEKALRLNPSSVDAQLNVANAYLKANIPDKALEHAQAAVKIEPNSGAGHFIAGSAYLRMGQAKPAAQALEQSKAIDRTVNAVSFQLGRAYQTLAQNEQAAEQFREVVKFEPEHSAAHYTLSQVLRLLNNPDEASQELAIHQELMKGKEGRITDASLFERSSYTQIRLPFRPEYPDPKGIVVTFVDGTAGMFGGSNYKGPAAVLDVQHNGNYSVFARESAGYRLLVNQNGVLQPSGEALPVNPDSTYSTALVGDLDNDRTDDVVILGNKGSHGFRVLTNGAITDVSKFSQLVRVAATNGLLADLDFSAKLGLAVVEATNGSVRFLRNLGGGDSSRTYIGPPYFSEFTTNSGISTDIRGARQLLVEDWNGDELLDLIITRENAPPLLLLKQRGGPFAVTNTPAEWPVSQAVASGDLDGDLHADVVLGAASELVLAFSGANARTSKISLGQGGVEQVYLVDYDNDGWLDIFVSGAAVRIWRNLGKGTFEERTAQVGLDKLKLGSVAAIWPADLDRDCDSDLLLTLRDGSLRWLRNEGGNANQQLKLQLGGEKSNASGIGARFEVASGGLRLSRRVQRLPVEVGVGQHTQIDAVRVFWDVEVTLGELKVDCRNVVAIAESFLPVGSCPYLYAWDGQRFRFVTDLLGAAPVGLPIADNRYIEADPEEYVWLGTEATFPRKGDSYVLHVTEELREALYLDEAKLVVVDHPPGTEVHTTGKLLAGKPFPKHEIVTLHKPHPLQQATNHEGVDVTEALRSEDQKMASPTTRRASQLVGLAEPHSVTLDFGPLDTEQPLVLAITAWLRFGGGTANISASHHPDLPFPFPVLEAETGHGNWTRVDVAVGAPAGKTKRIIVPLAGKLPKDTRRLRLSTAFEIHWDRIALLEQRDNSETRISVVSASRADLHWRGYSQFKELPWHQPLTPDYARVNTNPPWRITPSGWCTGYGEIGELISTRDNALALLNGGDELTLSFRDVPARPENVGRDFFFYSVGWDKDADFHCKLGTQVGPLPWTGMDDQRYGEQQRPNFPSDALMEKYNTRWVGPFTAPKGVRLSSK